MTHENCLACGTSESQYEEAQDSPQPNEPTPVFNVEHGMRVLGHLLTYPEQHDQGLWFKQNCKTTGCLAGWSSNLAGRTMVRSEPDNDVVDYVSLREGEISNSERASVKESYHYTPKPEFVAAKVAYTKAIEAYNADKETYDTEWRAKVSDWEMGYQAGSPSGDRPVYPAYDPPEMPYLETNDPDNYTVTTLPVIPISVAAKVDLGISDKMAGYLFAAHRTIGQITVVLGMLIGGRSEESIFSEYIDDVRPPVEELQRMLAEGRQLNRNMNALLLRMGA